MMTRAGVLVGVLALAAGGAAGQESQRPQAQARAPTFTYTGRGTAAAAPAAAGFEAAARPGRFRPLAVAKWVALGGAVTMAAFGYDANRVADSRYQDLDRICQSNPTRCLPRLPGGQYADAELESRYQDVRRLDRRATFGLVGAEVGLGAAVTLFLLDLRHAGGEPPDIPYKPPRLEVGPSRRGGMEVRLRLLR